MVFNSIVFAIFFPLFFLIYWSGKTNTVSKRNLWIVIASMIFYGWWDFRFLGLLFATAALDFFVAQQIEENDDRRTKKMWLLLSICGNLGVLGFFKYFNFFALSLKQSLEPFGITIDFVTMNIVLPVGISFYTFQALSYTIEVFRGNIKAERNSITYLAYMSFFPQLVARLIERATRLLPQFQTLKTFNRDFAVSGLRLMLWGLFKKVVLADNLSMITDQVFNHPTNQTSITSIIGILAFSIQIYCDFSGYSDIARGCARLLGFDLMQNFNFPYFADSLRNFWQRWHISLSTWFRDYLYIPLGGNRKGNGRNILNLFITFLISGLWHGPNLTFVIWGLIHGDGVIAETQWKRRNNFKVPLFFRRILTLFFVCLAWTFFRAKTVGDAWIIIKNVFSEVPNFHEVGFFVERCFGNLLLGISILFLSIGLFVVEYFLQKGVQQKFPMYSRTTKFTCYYGIILLILFFGVFHNAPAFIYFQF